MSQTLFNIHIMNHFLLQKGQRKVFFSALKKGSGEDFDGIITFTHIEVNEGGGFNKATGRFRAPLAGTYEFGFSAVTGLQRTRNWVAVFKGGSWHHNIYDGNKAHGSNHIGSSWMFKLRRNEEVYLKVAGGKIHCSHADFVHFTGQLLKADD